MTKTIHSVLLGAVLVVLKHSDNPVQAELNRAYFLVIDGKPVFPKMAEGVVDEKSARRWANNVVIQRGLLNR